MSNADSEQITYLGATELAQDQPLSPSEQFRILKQKLDTVEIKEISNRKVIVFENKGREIVLLTRAVTYLGNPHDKFKKRIQIPHWYQDFCKSNPNLDVRFLGIYNYKDNVVFVDFLKDTYIKKGKLHNSSAHVYINDLYQGITYGVFRKTDKSGNNIVTIRSSKLLGYLTGAVSPNLVLFSLIEKFNQQYPFAKWISSTPAIKTMQQGGWKQWRQAEWPGWFLEYKFYEFCKNTPEAQGVMAYVGSSHKRKNSGFDFDFDIHFIRDNFYGDLKASDINKTDAPGNDMESVQDCIYHCGKLWYVIYEHKTIKDSASNNYSATKERNRFIKSIDPSYCKDEMSYSKRMKHKVFFVKMSIIELNKVNSREILKDFHQGHQADGKPRKLKCLINKKMLDNDNYVIFRYEANCGEI